MRPPFRSRQEVIINAPLEAVWAFNMDLRRIPEFHPRVIKVDLISRKAFREAGAHINVILPAVSTRALKRTWKSFRWRRSSPLLPEDTFGIGKILTDYMVEALIDPFHKLVVYPSLLRSVRASWNQTFGTA